MRLPFRIAGMVAALLALSPATAWAAGRCGLTTVSGGTATVNYDPFSPTAVSINITSLTLSRVNGPGGEKTSSINFYVTGQTPAQNGTTMSIVSATGSGSGTGFNQNIFYNFGSPGPSPLDNSSAPVPGIFRWVFSGNNAASDTFTVNMQINLPANLNLTAGNQLLFDIVYSCAGTGAGGPFSDTGTVSGAISANVKVLSALQASYAGTDLAFGEIGNVTNTQVTSSPASYRTAASNFIRVQSSGPYRVTLTSGNGYRMTYPTGNLATATQRVNYSLKFLGETRHESATTAITKTCSAAGVGSAFEDLLYLQATLREGGQGKQVAPDYRDLLTVTIEPLVVPDPAVNCNSFTVP